MPKKKAPSAKPQTHFEQVPLEVVAKVAALDTPSQLTPARAGPVEQPSPPRPPKRNKE
jgi:hypothetical protein